MQEIALNIKPKKITKKPKGHFGRCVLIFSFSFITLYTLWVMWEQHRIGSEPVPTLTQWVYSFWGIEVMMLCLKRIFAKPIKNNNGEEV